MQEDAVIASVRNMHLTGGAWGYSGMKDPFLLGQVVVPESRRFGVLNEQCIQKESAVRIGLFVLAKGRILSQ
jgi:hypothetical protein